MREREGAGKEPMAAVKTRRRVEVLLKRSMLAAGMGLGLALAARYGLEKAESGAGQQASDLARRYAAEMLADWLARSFPAAGAAGSGKGEETWLEAGLRLLLPAAGQEWPAAENQNPYSQDPSFLAYLEEERLRKEASFLLSPDAGHGKTAEPEQTPSGETKETDGPEPAEDAGALPSGERLWTPAYRTSWDLPVLGTAYMVEQLEDYDFLMQNFYSVHTSTTARREEMQAERLLSEDLSIDMGGSGPQILIYHTHSQETYADYGPDQPDATVVGAGSYLAELLEAKGYRVLHDTSVYDLVDGKLDRSHAYNYALEGVTGILQQNPSIEVVLDLHRDGVDESVHMVTEVNGKPTAKIMFFNGMSQTPEGPIEYLPNPYKEDNLAFSLQMQLNAAAYFPGFTRNIYLKGLRYNLHLRPRSSLIEAGAQTNTYEEARNAMEPLAELLDMVLRGQ